MYFLVQPCVYTLHDPRTNAVRWVGCSQNLNKRLLAHLSDKKNLEKAAWIAELKALGLKPVIRCFLMLDKDSLEIAYRVERGLIRLMEDRGEPLLNKDCTSGYTRAKGNGIQPVAITA